MTFFNVFSIGKQPIKNSNVMLSLMSVMSPPPALCNLSARTVVKYFRCVCFRGELGFLNCDDIGMCVVNKQFELLEFVFNSLLR